MRILAYCQAFWPNVGGIETYIAILGRELHQRGVTWHVATETAAPEDGVNIFPFPVDWRPSPQRLRGLLADADIVHLHVFKPGLLRGARRLGKPVVNTYHDVTMICPVGNKMRWDGPCTNAAGPIVCARCLSKQNAPMRHLIRPPVKAALSALADANVVTSEWALQRYPLAHKRLIHYGIDTSRFRPHGGYAIAGRRARVVFMGRVVREKGVPILVEALARCVAQGKPFDLWVCGDGDDMPAVHEAIAKHNLAEYVGLRGFVTGDGVAQVFADADIAVVPSRWEEAFGITATEAMSSGLPVIAANTGGLGGQVGEVGLLFERDDLDQLTAHLLRLLDDAALREALGTRARKVALERYDKSRMAADHVALYEELRVRRRGGSAAA